MLVLVLEQFVLYKFVPISFSFFFSSSNVLSYFSFSLSLSLFSSLLLSKIQRDLTIWIPSLTLLYVEAVARLIKNHLFEKLRRKMEEFKLPLEAPYRKV